MIENNSYYEGAIPLEVQQKTDFLLRIWRDISYRVDDGAQDQVVKLKEKIIYKLNDLISEVYTGPVPVKSEDVPVKECIDESTGFMGDPKVMFYDNVTSNIENLVEQERQEIEKKQFVDFLLHVLAVAEHNREKRNS